MRNSDRGTKIKLVRANANKYPVSKMCRVLEISLSSYYIYNESNLVNKEFTG